MKNFFKIQRIQDQFNEVAKFLFLNVRSVNKCKRFLFEKCHQFAVSYSSKDDSLHTFGISFRYDGRKKTFLRKSLKSESDYDNRIETDQSSYTFPWGAMNMPKMESNSSNITHDTDPNKLAKSGDIECNPGPTSLNTTSQRVQNPGQNELKSSAGRKKKRGFQNKSTAENVTEMSHSSGNKSQFCTNKITLSSLMRDNPIGLRNEDGMNICFINSALQVLYFIPSLREYLSQYIVNNPGNSTLTTLKMVFDEMSISSRPVTIADYFAQLRGNFN